MASVYNRSTRGVIDIDSLCTAVFTIVYFDIEFWYRTSHICMSYRIEWHATNRRRTK